MRRSLCWVLLAMTLLAVGCASRRSGAVYSRDEALRRMTVYYGTVLTVRQATIEGTQSGVGPVMGGVAGAVAGSAIGSGSGQAIATVVGGIVGSLAGGVVEEGATRKAALELTVEMDNGEIIAVVQEADDEYAVGDRVRIVRTPDGATRVRQ